MRSAILTLAAMVALITPAGAQLNDEPASPPLGLWVWITREADTEVAVTVERSADGWSATVDGVSATVVTDDDAVRIETTDGQAFAGSLTRDDSEISGNWHQPSSPLAYAEMVTRSTIPRVAEGRWEADIVQQPRPFAVFLDIFEGEDGQPLAVIRNPERNEIEGATQFRVEANEDGGWTLAAERGGREIRRRLDVVGEGQLQLEHGWLRTGIPMQRATAMEGARYYPRPGDPSDLRYSPPPALDDGWNVATPEEAGFDRSDLDAMIRELANADPRERRPQLIHSVLVSHRGRLVLEEYFHGHDRETRHDTRSLAKVFGSVLIGAMQQNGFAIDADMRPIPAILAQAGQTADDPRTATISLRHLMTFTSGLDCSETSDSAGSEDRMWDQEEQPDFWLFTARLDQLHDPGTLYAYCSGSANLVGAGIRAAAGVPTPALFDRLIAEPLEFGPYHWNLAPNGAAYLGGGVYMRPRDILKIGAVYANGGTWNGERIIAPDWIAESTTPVLEISPETTGLSPEEFSNTYFGGSQAYIWRVDNVSVGERSYASYEASGNGGQLLIVVPELELAVVFTGGNYRMGGVWGRWRDAIVGGHIIPAMSEAP